MGINFLNGQPSHKHPVKKNYHPQAAKNKEGTGHVRGLQAAFILQRR